jgi:hypothetical protein
VSRHLGQAAEVPFAHLLPPRTLVQLDHLHPLRILEEGERRVVERQMAVLTDP